MGPRDPRCDEGGALRACTGAHKVSLCPPHPQDQRLNIIATDHAYRRNFTATSLKPTREIDVEETINTIIDMIVRDRKSVV